MSCPSVGRFGTLIRNETIPASSFETVRDVMSGAAGFSPVESWYVWLFAEAPRRERAGGRRKSARDDEGGDG